MKQVISLKYFRQLTSSMRLLPDFIVIGAQRCGTTSLFNYIKEHPGIKPSYDKEVHFFDNNFHKGITWYRSNFPPNLSRYYHKQILRHNFITGESSPYYIFHPHAPKRLYETLPQVKLLVILRNPVDRAYSHYNHEKKNGHENLSFMEAIEKEQERLNGEIDKMLEDENYFSFNHRHFSYQSRGIYINQLKAWKSYFSDQQFLIIKSEDLYDHTSATLNRFFDFMNLPHFELNQYKKYNVNRYEDMDSNARKYLTNYFKPHNHKLYECLNRDLGWDE